MQHCERRTKANRKRQANATALRLPDIKSFLRLKVRHKVLCRRLKRHFFTSHLAYFLSKMPALPHCLDSLSKKSSRAFFRWPWCTSPFYRAGGSSSGRDEAAGGIAGICNGRIHHGLNERPSNGSVHSWLLRMNMGQLWIGGDAVR